MADFDLVPAKTQFAPSSTTKFALVHLPVNVAVAVGSLVLNKTTRLLKIPKGFIVTSLHLVVSDMDTNGSPTLVLDLGDPTLSGRLISGSVVAKAGGILTTSDLAAAGLLYEFTANTDLQLKATTAAATAAAGTVKGWIGGYLR